MYVLESSYPLRTRIPTLKCESVAASDDVKITQDDKV